MRIGIISDTHGLLRPEASDRLSCVDHIIHAGDIGCAEVITELRRFAPVTAIRGNLDRGEWAAAYPHNARVTSAAAPSTCFTTSKNWTSIPPGAGSMWSYQGIHICRKSKPSVACVNPGSAGPRRFTLPISFATLELTGGALRPCIHDIGEPSAMARAQQARWGSADSRSG
jgi:uncharacterized protein